MRKSLNHQFTEKQLHRLHFEGNCLPITLFGHGLSLGSHDGKIPDQHIRIYTYILHIRRRFNFFSVIVYSFNMIHKTFERNETTLEYTYGHVKEFVRPKKKHYWAWTKILFDDYL